MNGQAPGPWDIQAQPAKMFQNSKIELEVPHTASVKVRLYSIQGGSNFKVFVDPTHKKNSYFFTLM